MKYLDYRGIKEFYTIDEVCRQFEISKQELRHYAEKYGIHSVASLTAYMIDGTGMCGGCRCKIGGEDKFVCVDGPEFDGALVDWDDLIRRSAYYKDQEAEDRAHVCRLTGGVRYHD